MLPQKNFRIRARKIERLGSYKHSVENFVARIDKLQSGLHILSLLA